MKNPDKDFLEKFKNGDVDKNATIPSPIGEYLQASIIDVDDDAYKLSMGFEGQDHMYNGAGVIQGGILTSMLDTTMAFAVLSHVKPEQSTATISINTDFLNAAKTGSFVVEAEITRMGRNIAFAKATLKNAEGTLIASATANFAIS